MTENESNSYEETLTKFKSNIITLFEEIWALRGNNPIAGRLYAIILLSTKPLTQRELEEASGYSRGQISKTLKDLESALFVEKSRQIGTREKLYHVGSGSFLKTFADRMKIASEILRRKMKQLEVNEKEWMELPKEIQESAEAKRILEVGEIFFNYYDFYLSSMDSIIEKIENKIKELEIELRKR
ncbi:MAG: GbsR/MarR family transcriptional regulator [Candidatus Hodarchaeota archaeon]